jgi:hypothetical protein
MIVPLHYDDTGVDIVDILEGNTDGPYQFVIAEETGDIESEGWVADPEA